MLKISAQTGEAVEISVFDLLEGGVKELAELNLQRVLDNIRDLNTDPKKTRTLTVSMKFLSNDDRDTVNVDIQVDSKLAPIKAVATTLDIGDEGGKVVACERPKYTPGQMRIDAVAPEKVVSIHAAKTAAEN